MALETYLHVRWAGLEVWKNLLPTSWQLKLLRPRVRALGAKFIGMPNGKRYPVEYGE